MKKSILLLTSISLIVFLTSFLPQEHQTIHNKTPRTGHKVGKMAPEIELYTPDSTLFKLSSLRGHMVLVEFWATWCEGCRTANKHLRPVYDKYHDQKFTNGTGFYIVSVSLDTERQRWIDGIEADSIQYTINVSDLNGIDDSKVAKDYNVGGLPMRFLIDGNGIIIMDWHERLVPTLEKYLIKE
jgi:thiol-disulfide isomerase/thioredoxin